MKEPVWYDQLRILKMRNNRQIVLFRQGINLKKIKNTKSSFNLAFVKERVRISEIVYTRTGHALALRPFSLPSSLRAKGKFLKWCTHSYRRREQPLDDVLGEHRGRRWQISITYEPSSFVYGSRLNRVRL